MRSLEQCIQVNLSPEECLQLWISNHCYPTIRMDSIPQISTHWSSADAWGENRLYGHSQTEWSLRSLPGDSQIEIVWQKEFCLKRQLVQLSGHVEFNPNNGNQTFVKLSTQSSDCISLEQLSKSVQRCVDVFKILAHETTQHPAHLKVAM